MVHSAAYDHQSFVECDTADTYFDDGRQVYCPLCGHEIDCNVRFCRTCGHALTSDLMAQSGRLVHSFSAAGANQKRKTTELREPGALSFQKSKRAVGGERSSNPMFQFFLGIALLIITVVSVFYFLNGKTLY